MSLLLREQWNPPQVVLVSILACLWYLSILGAFVPYSILKSFKHGDYAFSIDLQDAYLHIPYC